MYKNCNISESQGHAENSHNPLIRMTLKYKFTNSTASLSD